MGLFDDLKPNHSGGLFDDLKSDAIKDSALEPQERRIPIQQAPVETADPQSLMNILGGQPFETQKRIVSDGDPYNVPEHVAGATLFKPEATNVEINPGKNIPIPTVPVTAEKKPIVKSSAKLIEFAQERGKESKSATATTDQQIRAREVLDEFGGDKQALRGKVGQLGKSLNLKRNEIDDLYFDIINKASAFEPGTTMDAGALEIETSEVPLDAPVSDPTTVPKAVTTKKTISPKSILEGIEQAVVRSGGGKLDINEQRKIASKAGQITGDLAQLSMSIGSTVGLGKTLAKSSSKIVSKIGGILANPNINPIPDAAYAANADGKFAEEFFKGYAINLVASGLMEGRIGFKPFKDMSGEDRKIMKDFLAKYQEGVEAGKIPKKFQIDIPQQLQMDLGLDKVGLLPSTKIPTESGTKEITVVGPAERTGHIKVPDDPTSWSKAFPIRNEIRGLSKSMQSRINATNKRLFDKVDELRRVMKANPDVAPKLINDALISPELRASGELPEKVLTAVNEVRTMIDDLSTQLELDGNILSEALEVVVDANKGIYLKRSYKKFNDKKWWDKVSKDKQVMSDAREFVKESYGDKIMKNLEKNLSDGEFMKRKIAMRKELGRKLTDKELASIRSEVDAIGGTPEITKEMYDDAIEGELELIATAKNWSSDGMNNFKSWLGSVNRNNLKKRKDIPLPIRKLLGEIEDPITNSIFTAQAIATQLEQSRFNREIIDRFMLGGDSPIIFEQATKGYTTPITLDMGFGAKKTLYTSKQFAKEFKQIKTDFSAVTKMAMKANGALKSMQTVYNPKSHLRNFYGNSIIAAFNGHIHATKMATAVKMLVDSKANPALIEELTKEGLLSSNVMTGQLAELTRKSFGVFNKDVDNLTLKQLSKQQTDLPANWAQKLYQAEDDVWKIYGYLNEIERGYPKKDAIENAKKIYPNYANLPRWHDWLKEQGWSSFVSTFTAFPTSMLISAGNALELAGKEMAGKTSLGKKSFGRALAIGASAGVYAGRHEIVDMYNRYTGDGETFSDKFNMSNAEVAKIIKENGSPWEKFADIMPTRIIEIETPSGDTMTGIEYYNNSYLNPLSVITDPVDALVDGNVAAAAFSLMQPYTDPSMLTSLAITLMTGKDANNKEIRSVQDPFVTQLSNSIIATGKSISPWAILPNPEKIRADIVNGEYKWEEWLPIRGVENAFKNGTMDELYTGSYWKAQGYEAAKWDKAARGYVDEYGKKYTYQQELTNFATGTRKQIFIPEQSMKNNLWSTKAMYQISMRTATRAMRNQDDESIVKMYVKDGEKFRRGAWDQMRDQIETFKKFGMTDKDVIDGLREIGVSRKMGASLISGKYRPYKPTKEQMKAIRRSREKKGLGDYEFEF